MNHDEYPDLPEPRPPRRAPHPVRRYVLVTLSGLLRVTPCPLCGALTVLAGADAHERWHAAPRIG